MGALAGFAAADSSTLPNDMLSLDDSGDVQIGNREKVSAFDRVMRETVAAKLWYLGLSPAMGARSGGGRAVINIVDNACHATVQGLSCNCASRQIDCAKCGAQAPGP